MKTKLIALALTAACSAGGAVIANDLTTTIVYPPQGPAILVYRPVSETTTIALLHGGRGVGSQASSEAKSEPKLVAKGHGNGQPVSYFEPTH